MNAKIKILLLSGVLAGAMVGPAAPAMAREYWHSNHNKWDARADVRSDQRDLAEARRQLEYDRAHHASRRTINQDEARVKDIARDLREDKRLSRR